MLILHRPSIFAAFRRLPYVWIASRDSSGVMGKRFRPRWVPWALALARCNKTKTCSQKVVAVLLMRGKYQGMIIGLPLCEEHEREVLTLMDTMPGHKIKGEEQ